MRFVIVFIFFSGNLTCIAQFSIRGTIKDATNQSAILGASVYLPDLRKGTLTDIDGKFTIDNLSRGKFLVQVRSVGYGSVVKQIEVGKQEELNIILTSSVTELSEVVISGVSHSTELKKNPIPIVTLSNALLLANHGSNLIENITQEPGVYQVSTGVAVAKPVIRGLGYNRIITIFDGIRQEGQQWGDEHGIEIDEFSVDRVEIIKGAGSLLYGSDGMGGVINFLSPNPVAMGIVETTLTSNYQTNHGLISNSIMNAGNRKGFFWLGRVSQKASHAYKNQYDGYVFNSGFREKDYSIAAGLNKSWGFTQFSFSSFQQNIGLIEGERDPEGHFIRLADVGGSAQEIQVPGDELKGYTIHIPRQQINHRRLSSLTNLFYGGTRFQLNLGYQQNVRREFGDVLNSDEPDLFFNLQSVNYNATVYLPEFSGWDFSLSTSGMWQQNQNKGLEFLIPEFRMADWGTVAFAKKNFNKMDVAGGIRVDQRMLFTDALYLDEAGRKTNDRRNPPKFSEGRFSFKNYSASLGMTYQFSDFITAKLNTSRGFRAPNIAELTSNGQHEGSLRYEYGNFDLKPETSLQADFSTLFNSPHISAEVSLYQNNIENYIYTKKLLSKDGNDSIPDLSDPYPAYAFTQGKARLTGGEFSIDLHPHPLDWLHIENALSLVYAQNRSEQADSSKFLPFTPAHRLQSEIRASSGKWLHVSNAFIKIQYQHYWKQNRVLLENGTETPTPSYNLWSAGFGFDVPGKKQKKLFTFYFTAENIFDKAYQNNLSRLKYAAENPLSGRRGVFNMGRNFSFRILIPVLSKIESKRS